MSLDILVANTNEGSPIVSSPSTKPINYETIIAVAPPPIEVFRCLKHNNDLYHDIFISYRVNTEKKVADKLALLLDACTKQNDIKIRTFLDSNCLVDGGNWEKNFLSALHHAKLIVLLVSEAGLDLPSSSDPTKTKIQNADHEQDNCLLEYEYAMRLKEEHKADIFLLLVPKETVLGGIKCTVKFPTSPQAIERRLAMYAETQHHHHRDKTKGPLVADTMRKLLGLIFSGEMNYAHMDPDDLSARLPEVLWKLHQVEKKESIWKKVKMGVEDVGGVYIRTFAIGIFVGLIFPAIALCCTFDAKSTRHRALRAGIIMAHSLWFLGLSIAAFYATYSVDKCKNCEENESNAYMFLAIICLILSIAAFAIVIWLKVRGQSTKGAATYQY